MTKVIEIVPPRDLCESCYVRTLRTYVRMETLAFFITKCRSRFEIRFELVIFGHTDLTTRPITTAVLQTCRQS